MQKLYYHPWLTESVFILLVERNLAAGPYAIERAMEAKFASRTVILTDQKREHISGYWTNANLKADYIIKGARQFRQDKCVFLKDLVCENIHMDENKRASIAKKMLLEQIPRFRIKQPMPGSSRKRDIITGKLDETGKFSRTSKDDLAFAYFASLWLIDGISSEEIPNLDYSFIKGDRRRII